MIRPLLFCAIRTGLVAWSLVAGAPAQAQCGDSTWCLHVNTVDLMDLPVRDWYDELVENYKHEEDLDDPKKEFYVPDYHVAWISRDFYPGMIEADSVRNAVNAHLREKNMHTTGDLSSLTTVALELYVPTWTFQYVKGGFYRFRIQTLWMFKDAVSNTNVYSKVIDHKTPLQAESIVPFTQNFNTGVLATLDQLLADAEFQKALVRKGPRYSLTYYQWPELELPGPTVTIAKINDATKGVVTITGPQGTCSGLIVSSLGHLISSRPALEGQKGLVKVQLSNGEEREAEILRTDHISDLALLQMNAPGGVVLATTFDSLPELGDEVFAIGAPGGASMSQSLSRGVMSGRRNIDGRDLIQTDAAMSPGNFGGPLLDEHGVVLGVVAGKLHDRGVEGLGFAIPMKAVEEALRVRFPRASSPAR